MKNYSAKEINIASLLARPARVKLPLPKRWPSRVRSSTAGVAVETNNTLSDNTDIEHEYKRSIYSTILFTEFMDRKLNIIDCPGSDDFCGSLFSAFKVGDVGVFLFNAQNGWEVGSARFRRAIRANCCRNRVIGVINQLDAEKANFEATVESHPRRVARETRHRAVPRQPGAGASTPSSTCC